MAYDPDLAFTDEMADALQELCRFLVACAAKDEPPLNDLKDRIESTLTIMTDPQSCVFGVIDLADEALRADNLFPEDVDKIIDDLYDDLNGASPMFRVQHSPSDGWSAIERMTGDGRVSPVAYFASPSLAEDMIDAVAARSDSL